MKSSPVSTESQAKHRRRTVAEWKGQIAGNQNWALRAALRIFKYQTTEEADFGATLESNGVGFNGFDANFVTSVVKQHLEGRRLTKKQSDALRRIMPKYAEQLYRIVYEKPSTTSGGTGSGSPGQSGSDRLPACER